MLHRPRPGQAPAGAVGAALVRKGWGRSVNTVNAHDSTAVIDLDEESIKGGLLDLRDQVGGLMTEGSVSLIMDLSRVQRPSSRLLASLLWAHRVCHSRGGRVVLRGPNEQCQHLLARAGLRRLFHVTPSRTSESLGDGLIAGTAA